MRYRHFLFLLCILSLPQATSQAKDPQSLAQEMFEGGKLLYQHGRYAEALERLEAAFALVPSAVLLYNIALCQQKLGHVRAAMESFRRFIEMDPGSSKRASAKEQIRHLLARVPGQVEVTSRPEAATVQVDGEVSGITPCVIEVAPGEHRITVFREGFQPAILDIRVAPGMSHAFSPELIHLAVGREPQAVTRTDWMPNTASWVLMGLGTATLASAAVTGGVALATQSEANAMVTGDPDLTSTQARADRLELTTNILLGGGGALLLAGGLVWLLSSHEVVEERAVLGGLSPQGLVLWGRF